MTSDRLLLLSCLLLHVVIGMHADETRHKMQNDELHFTKAQRSSNLGRKEDKHLGGTMKSTIRRLQNDANEDDEDDELHVNYLTTCIMPYRKYIPSEENQFRVPYGNVRITFDGGEGIFNKISGGQYPGYDPDLEFTFRFDLQGLPTNCEKCRIQVNEGDSCDEPGIRFWDRSVEGSENPWRHEWGAVYNSNKHGQARGFFSMFDGFEFDDHKSRTVVVFAEDAKTRLGCGVIRRREFGECGNDPQPDPSVLPSQAPIIITVPPNVRPPAPPPSYAPSAPIEKDPTNAPAQTTARPTPRATKRPTPPYTARPTPRATERPTPPTTGPSSSKKGKGGKGGSSSNDSKKKSGKMTKLRRARYTRGLE